MFHIGDRVIWTTGVIPEGSSRVGRVVGVTPSVRGLDDFHIYDVEFAFGVRVLQGAALQPAPENIFSCEEKNLLFSRFRKAVDIYSRVVSEFSKLAGAAVHSEVEFVKTRVAAAKQAAFEASHNFKEHCRKHRC